MQTPVFTAAFGIVNYVYNMSDIDFLANTAIYGGGVPTEEKQTSETNTKNLKRNDTSSEAEAKEAYNKSKMPRRAESSEKNKNRTGSIKDFFKKFFD